MTIDIRTRILCDLGDLISGEVSDSQIPDAGIITTTGSVVLKGTVSVEPGDVINISYLYGGQLVFIPRKLLVLGSFADPFRDITTINIGCPFTYYGNLKPEQEDDEDGTDCSTKGIIPPRIKASSVLNKCAKRLKVTPVQLSLTNSFLLDEFDYSSGYVQVLDDLLKSEGYIAYINRSGQLRGIKLNQAGDNGPVIDQTNLIDIGPIGIGEIPATTVKTTYSSQKLKKPDPAETDNPGSDEAKQRYQKRNWEEEVTFSGPTYLEDTYVDAQGNDVTETIEYSQWSKSTTYYDNKDRPTNRIEVVNGPTGETETYTNFKYKNTGYISYNPDFQKDFYTDPSIGNPEVLSKNGVKIYLCGQGPDTEDVSESEDIESEERYVYAPSSVIIQACGFNDQVFYGLKDMPDTKYLVEYTRITYQKDIFGTYTKTTTERFLPEVLQPEGRESINRRASKLFGPIAVGPTSIERASIIDAAKRLTLESTEVRIRTEREFGLQKRPPASERISSAYSKTLDAFESTDETLIISGSASSENVLEFQVPYSCDDIIVKVGNTFEVEESDAKIKAKQYGKIQNKLIRGLRSGVSIQIPAGLMPARPFSAIYLEAGGIIGMYRVNATSWAFDSNGIIASCDALYWGAIPGDNNGEPAPLNLEAAQGLFVVAGGNVADLP